MGLRFLKFDRGVLPLSAQMRRFLVILAVLQPLGCLEPGQKDPSACSDAFEKVIVPVKIQNKQEVYFNISDFDFLTDPALRIDSVTVDGTMIGHHSRHKDYSFSLNGIKCSRRDGDDNLGYDDKDKGRDRDDNGKEDDQTERHFSSEAHKFYLNGGLSFLQFLLQIKKNQGVVRLMIHGHDHEAKNVKIIVKGTRFKTCTNPPPPPPPPPVAPKTTLNSETPAQSPTALATMSIAFTADQNNVSFSCSLDGSAATACTSPAAFSGLSNGAHVFKVFATNSSGLSDVNPPQYAWTVDSLPPTVQIDNLASLPSLTNSGAISVSFSSVDPLATFKCSIDGAAASVCISPKAVFGLLEGAHKFSVWSVDEVGNVSVASADFQWTIDQTAPVTTIISASPAEPINHSSTISLQFAANESASFACSVDNNAFQACVSPLDLSALSEGSHFFQVRATDVAGNQGLGVSYNWTSDFTAPVIHLGAVIPAVGATSAHNFSAEFAVNEPGTLTCSFDGSAPAACTSPFIMTVAQEGPHQLIISATDLAGNVSVPQILVWTTDYTSPQLTFGAILPSPASFINSSTVTLEILSTEPTTIMGTLNGASLGQVNSPIVLNSLAEGFYSVQFSGYDAVGNPSNVLSYNFTVDLTPPIATLASQVSGSTRLDSNVLTFSSNEPGDLQCNVDSAGFGPCASPLNLSGLAQGAHEVLVRAVDRAGNVSAIVNAQWTVDTVAPLTTLSAQQTSGNSLTFTLFSSEVGSTFTCALDSAPAQPCSSPVSLNSIPAGSHTFNAWATDAAGNTDLAGASYAFTINPPVSTSLTSSPNSAFTNQTGIAFSFTSNQASATFICAIDGAALAACAGPKVYTGLADGAHSFVVKAVDVWGSVDPDGASFAWTIDTIAPSTTISTQQLNGNSFRFTLGSSEPGTFLCSFDIGAAQLCSSPYSLSGMNVGSHQLKVWAVDQAGNQDAVGTSAEFAVQPPVTTTITSARAAPITNQTGITFGFSSNLPEATFICSMDGAAAVACTSPKSYAGLPDGSHTFVVRAVDSWGTVDTIGASFSWTIDTVAPTQASISFTSTSTSITINWTTSELATTKLLWGKGNLNNTVPDNGVYATSHSVRLTGLSPNSTYTIQTAGKDQAGNTYTGPTGSPRTTN